MRGSMSHEPQVTLQHEPSLDAVDQNAGLVANKLTTTLGLKGSRGAMLSGSSGQERLHKTVGDRLRGGSFARSVIKGR